MSRTRFPSHPDVRVARGVLLTVTTAVVSLSAHTAADGVLPDPSLAVAIAALTGWLSTTLADRTRATRSGGIPGLLLTLAAAQLVIHLALSVFGPHHDVSGGPGVDAVTMLAAHAVATVVLAVLIAHAERGLLTVAAGLRRMLPVVPAALPFPSPPAPAVLAPPVPAVHTAILLRRVHARRGPPAYS